MKTQRTLKAIRLLAASAVVLSISSTSLRAQQTETRFNVADEITFRTADIMSEGTRMAAEVFAPRDTAKAKLPTIIMCHGWGGIAEHLRPDAILFAKAGYLVVTFDYRGWGNSDSRVILTQLAPALKKQQSHGLTSI